MNNIIDEILNANRKNKMLHEEWCNCTKCNFNTPIPIRSNYFIYDFEKQSKDKDSAEFLY